MVRGLGSGDNLPSDQILLMSTTRVGWRWPRKCWGMLILIKIGPTSEKIDGTAKKLYICVRQQQLLCLLQYLKQVWAEHDSQQPSPGTGPPTDPGLGLMVTSNFSHTWNFTLTSEIVFSFHSISTSLVALVLETKLRFIGYQGLAGHWSNNW